MSFACHLSNRTVKRLSGDDRRVFLQGLISNDIEACQPNHPIYAALLTPQGKFSFDMFIVDEGDAFLIDCETVRGDDLVRKLNMYKLRAKVTIQDVADEVSVYAYWGHDLVALSAVDDPHLRLYFVDPRFHQLGIRAVTRELVVRGRTTSVPWENYDRHRLLLGVPDGSRDMDVGKSTLLECNMDKLNAVSWSKGCYVGQELTARMHYRALLKKRLYPVKVSGPMTEPGTPLVQNGLEIGEMRSHIQNLGLALLNIEVAERALMTSQELRLDDATLLHVSPIPY